MEIVTISGKNHSSLTKFKKRIEDLGFAVKLYSVPLSLEDWCGLPFLREKNGSSWFGADGIEAFISKHQNGVLDYV